ncbi:MAG TPA: penicillin acylase family protein, partial [Polyangiaceae bacterium]|nr:penicillin acylase family protein [Polyangiaceae bacterium]
MHFLRRLSWALFCGSICGSMLAGCTDDGPLRPDEKILGVAETESWQFPQLLRPVYVVRTEANIPHIYAYNRRDLALVEGFVMARDRYFMMDLTRRLGTGTVSELLGQDALTNDQESRGNGMAYVAAQIDKNFSPELAEYATAFAEGVNEYIHRVQSGELPPPSELEFASKLLFDAEPGALMKPFDRASVAAIIAVILYNSSYETGDVGRSQTAAALPTLFEGAPYQALRHAGAIQDLWQAIEPSRPFVSAPGMGTFENYSGPAGTAAGATMQERALTGIAPPPSYPPHSYPMSSALLARASQHNAHFATRLRRDRDGFGSNAWAVAGYA